MQTADTGTLVQLPPDEGRHATRVLRLRHVRLYSLDPSAPRMCSQQGDAAEVCDLQGTLGRGVVHIMPALAQQPPQRRAKSASDATVYVELTQPPTVQPRAGTQWEVWVACGSLKGGRADWLVEKCVELGAATLVPLLTARSPTCSGGDGALVDGCGAW